MATKQITKVEVELIDPNRFQQRKDFDSSGIRELADSIKEHGLMSPVLLRPNPDASGRYELCAGERRVKAHKLLKRKHIEAIVQEDIDDTKLEEMALIENVQRADLSVIEEAEGYNKLLGRYEGDFEVVAKKTGKARQTIEKRIALLGLDTRVQTMADTGQISLEQAEELLAVKDPEEQNKLAKAAIRAKMDANRLKGIIQSASKIKDTKGRGNNEGQAPKPVTFAKLNKDLIALADGLERFDLASASVEDLQTLNAQLGALVEQINEDVLPAVAKRLRNPRASVQSDPADGEDHEEIEESRAMT